MKEDSEKAVIRQMQALVTRETGAPLSVEAEREMKAILRAQQQDEAWGDDAVQTFVRRDVTILFADLRGFTAMTSALPTELVIGLLNRCLGRMNEVISQHSGVVDKFMGDSIMVLFGLPHPHPDDVIRALACAIDMQHAMAEINRQNQQEGIPELFMGIGINTGSVMAGRLGSHIYSEYTVIGDEVNLASRIESFSLRGQILIGENTYASCRYEVTVSDAMEVFVKGKARQVMLRELLAIPAQNRYMTRIEARRSQRLTVHLPCSCQLVKNKIVMPRKIGAVIRDIGYHGMLIEIDHEVRKLDDLRLDFEIPLVDFVVSEIYAKVAQLRVVGKLHLAGVEFTSLSADASMKIQLFVQMLAAAEHELETDSV